MELFQAEWCPHSHAVRQRLTELGLDFVARQVPADPDDRDELERVAGTNEIPVLVADDGAVYRGDDEILDFLDHNPTICTVNGRYLGTTWYRQEATP